ncbi:hypothetical protein ES703_58285 [subsurface metagenome]
MSEAETEAEGQKPTTSRLAILSVISGIASFTGLFILPIASLMSQLFFHRTNFDWANPFIIFPALLSISIFSIIVGAMGVKKVRKSNGLLTGGGIARFGQVISIPALVWASSTLLVMFTFHGPDGRITKELMCSVNLSRLGKAMLIYANDYDDQYPTKDKWCDLLIGYDIDVDEQWFKCPAKKKHRCSYAINPNCEPNGPPDVVLLFEAKEGWNQFGGPEILTTENHKGKGCNVSFNNGRVEFVKPERIGELKWEVEQK